MLSHSNSSSMSAEANTDFDPLTYSGEEGEDDVVESFQQEAGFLFAALEAGTEFAVQAAATACAAAEQPIVSRLQSSF